MRSWIAHARYIPITCLVSSLSIIFISSLSCLFFSHPPQTLSYLLNITLIPSNDNRPSLSIQNTTLVYFENAMLSIFSDISIEDRDETCQNNILLAAQVMMETPANDNENEMLIPMETIYSNITQVDAFPNCTNLLVPNSTLTFVPPDKLSWIACSTSDGRTVLLIEGEATVQDYQVHNERE